MIAFCWPTIIYDVLAPRRTLKLPKGYPFFSLFPVVLFVFTYFSSCLNSSSSNKYNFWKTHESIWGLLSLAIIKQAIGLSLAPMCSKRIYLFEEQDIRNRIRIRDIIFLISAN